MMLTLNLLTTTIVVPPSNASKWQIGFNSVFKGLKRILQKWAVREWIGLMWLRFRTSGGLLWTR